MVCVFCVLCICGVSDMCVMCVVCVVYVFGECDICGCCVRYMYVMCMWCVGLFVWLLFYILETPTVISGRVSTCDCAFKETLLCCPTIT